MGRTGRAEILPFALGLAVGGALLSLVELEGGRLASTLALEGVPPAEFGVAPSPRVVEAGTLQRAAADGLTGMLGWLGALTLLLAVGGAGILLSVRGSLRAHGVAVRAALGAPWSLQLRRLLRLDARPLLTTGLAWGMGGGVAGAVALRLTWPFGPEGSPGLLGLAAGLSGAALAAGAALLPLRYGRGDLGRILGAGGRVGRGYLEGGMRRILTVVQLTACLALLSGAALLVGAGSGAGDAGEPGPPPGVEGPAAGTGGPLAGTVLLPLAFDDAADAGERHRAWEALAERVRGLPTVRAESIATPGAWKGLGRRDLVLADCGACVRGGLMVPFLGEDALHHAVSPDFFRSRGIPVLSGRGFTREDGPDARPVAVVNRTFALRSFERGDPLGRGVRVGGEGDRWYTVVGVVGDPAGPGLGRSGEPRPMLYLSSLQHPPDRAVLSLTLAGGGSVGGGAPPDDGGLPGGGIPPGLLDGLPLRATGPARTAEAWRARDAAPLLWAGRVSALAGVVTILVALLGVRAVSRIEVAARRRELGVRLALGATPRQVRLHVLGRSVRAALLATLLAVPASVAVAARVEELAGDVPLFQPGPYLLLAGLVVLAAGLGAWGPSAVAERTEPAVVLQEE